MASRTAVVVVGIGLVAALAGAVAWLGLGDSQPAGEGGGEAAPASSPATGPVAAPPRPRAQSGAWRQRGEGRVVGILRDRTQPIAGVSVELHAGPAGPDRVLATKTAADGAFAFERVPDFAAWAFRARLTEPKVDVEQAGIAVFPEKTTDLGVVYAASPVALSGVVADTAGAPVAGADVRLTRPFNFSEKANIVEIAGDVFDEPAAVVRTTSGPDGRFKFDRAPPGSFDVLASKEEFARGVARVTLLAGAAPPDLRIVLDPGHAVVGRVVRTDGGRVEGIPVRALPTTGGIDLPWQMLPRITSATTGASGEFRLSGLAAGRWKVTALPVGEAASRETVATAPAAAPIEIALGGDATLAGRVLGPDDAPVADASIAVQVAGQGEGGHALGRSGSDGRYEIRGFASGTSATVLATARGHPPFGSVFSMMDDSAPNRVDLVPGTNPFDIRFAPGSTLRGRVVERGTERGLAAVRVRVRPSGMEGMLSSSEGWTDAEGRFEITGLPVGEQGVSLEKQGWHSVGSASKGGFGATIMKLVEDGEESGEEDAPAVDTGKGLDIVTTAGGVVERVLSMERAVIVAGRVLGPDGAPVPGAKVRLDEGKVEDGGFDLEAMMSSLLGGGKDDDDARVTDAAGAFELTAPPGKSVRVVASAPGLVDGKSEEVKGEAGARVEGVEIRLDPGATVEGRVTTPEGAPAADVEVRWRTEGKDDPMTMVFGPQMGAADEPHARTDADGRFRVTGVTPGGVEVTARRSGFLPTKKGGLTLKAGETATVEITLDRGAAIAGVVVDPSGRGVAGAQVKCTRADGGPMAFVTDDGGGEAQSDAEGKFRIEGLATAKHVVRASAPGFVLEAPVEAQSGAGDTVTVRLAPELTLTVNVTCRGRPVAGASVSVEREDARAGEEDDDEDIEFDVEEAMEAMSRSGTTGADGRFVAKGLRSGTYEVTAEAADDDEDGPRANILRTVVRGVSAGAASVVVDCPQGLEISGTVLCADGTRAAKGSVAVTDHGPPDADPDDEDAGAVTWCEAKIANGTFSVVGLAPGKYGVEIEVPGHARRTIVTEAGKPLGEIRLELGGTVKGRLVMPSGAGARMTFVNLESDDGERGSSSDWADQLGRFTLTGAPPGGCKLSASVESKGRRWTAAIQVVVRAGATTDVGDVRLADAGPAEEDDEDEQELAPRRAGDE